MSTSALIVHDLKNELGALEASLQRLALRPVAGLAETAHRQCRRLRQRLVMYLSVYGGADELRPVRDDESPAELLAAIAARHAEPDAGIEVVFRADPDAPACWYLDRRLVMMALDAALHNALRFARHRIELGLRVEESHLVITVDDDGPGLDPAVPLEQHGTGLGTILCRAVAQAHGTHRADGGVRLFNRGSRKVRRGARFELWLAT